MTPEQARDHPLSHILTRALGTEPNVDADSYGAAFQLGDTFLLCSDGLSGMVTDEELEEILKGSDLQGIADALIDAANAAGGMDNITAIVVRVEE